MEERLNVSKLSGWAQARFVMDGDEAWSRLKIKARDRFVTDLAHPGLPGEDILRELAAPRVNSPILVLSGLPDEKERRKFRTHRRKTSPKLGITVMMKSSGFEALIKKLAALLAELSDGAANLRVRPPKVFGGLSAAFGAGGISCFFQHLHRALERAIEKIGKSRHGRILFDQISPHGN